MKIAFIGTRGIPNSYGGFEQFVEYLSVGLVEKGHEVYVYAPKNSLNEITYYKGVKIVYIINPEYYLGPFANFIYDWLSLKDAIKYNFDIIYQAGYQSSAISICYYKKYNPSIVVTNMDGIEWKRSKWNYYVKLATKFFEKLAVKYSDYLISDNIGIQKYYKETFNKESFFMPYGANISNSFKEKHLLSYNLNRKKYYLIIARIEPENNIEMIIDGFINSNSNKKLVVVGNNNNSYGKKLTKKYKKYNLIKFIGSIYNIDILNSLRFFSISYFHGHSVGGTNPSLLEAMASKVFIISHDNIFNRSILKNNCKYFKTSMDITNIINSKINSIKTRKSIVNNLYLLKEKYSWKTIINSYEDLFYSLTNNENYNNNTK